MKLRIGTRKSKLALAQTALVENALKRAYPQLETELVPITTKGDRILDKSLAQIGGKGLFISEIETALLENRIDLAVHSAKDLPVAIAEDLEISGVLQREDSRDCLVTRTGEVLKNNEQTRIGTGSMRRRQFFRQSYDKVSFLDIRGNIDTRIQKLLHHEYDGIILAMAGLKRLGIQSDESITLQPLSAKECLPAPCQAIIAIESRKHDKKTDFIKAVSHMETQYAFETERYIIEKIGGDCGIPLGIHTEISANAIEISLSVHPEKIVSGTADITDRIKLAERLVNEL